MLQVIRASVLFLNLIQGSLNFEQVLRVAGCVLVGDDQFRGGRETLEIHSSTSLEYIVGVHVHKAYQNE